MSQEQRRFLEVFTIREYIQDKTVKSYWTKIGHCFENKDGSWNVRLHALPLTNPKTGMAEMHMRLPRPKEDRPEQAPGEAAVNGVHGDPAPYAFDDDFTPGEFRHVPSGAGTGWNGL
jgi:hypothetical protein